MVINNIKYEIIKDDNHTCDEELLKEMMTDYFASYDYIVGDWSYNKLRLKGFNDKSNKNPWKIWDYTIGGVSQENMNTPYIFKGNENSAGYKPFYFEWC